MSRAVLEGVAFELRMIRDTVCDALGGPLPQIALTGGGSESRVWPAIVANVLGCSIAQSAVSECTALGASILGAVGSGEFSSVEDAVDSLVHLDAPVEPDDVVVIDSGTTTEYLARAIPEDAQVTIVCYTLNILFEIYKRKACKIIFAGGYYHDNTMMFESLEGRQLIRKLRATKSFLGATGISDKLGVTCSNECEPEVKRAALDSSLKRILLADSSKFELVRPYYFADLNEFDIIVTDEGIPSRYEKLIRDLGKTLVIA